jgi:hypothetical protein
MAKVVNRLFLVALCFMLVMCGLYLTKDTPQVDGQLNTVLHAPARASVATMNKGFTPISYTGSGTENLKCVDTHVSAIEGIAPGSSVERGPVLQKHN